MNLTIKIIINLLFISCHFSNENDPKYIILSNYIFSDWYLTDLIITHDSTITIKQVESELKKEVIYELRNFTLILINKEEFDNFFNYLNVRNNDRDEIFSGKEVTANKDVFVFSYLTKKNKRLLLLRVNSGFTTFFILKQVFCYVKKNINNEKLTNCLSMYYYSYNLYFDSTDDKIKDRIECE